MSQSATSGFLFPTDLEWLNRPGFCHLKLHGTCTLPIREMRPVSWPPQPGESVELTSAQMFAFETLPRLATFSNPVFASQEPPVLLPWEIISNDGQLLKRAEFETRVGSNWQHKDLYPLFEGIWKRARNEVQEADKISFVGLSLGAFMEPELKHLFSGKSNIVQAVVANPENQKYKDYANPFYPTTLCGKLLDVLYQICPKLSCNRSDSEWACPKGTDTWSSDGRSSYERDKETAAS